MGGIALDSGASQGVILLIGAVVLFVAVKLIRQLPESEGSGPGGLLSRLIQNLEMKGRLTETTLSQKGPSEQTFDVNNFDEQFYEQAADELSRPDIRPGLRAKAFSEADGDERKADAVYIRLRVAQLRKMREQNLSQR